MKKIKKMPLIKALSGYIQKENTGFHTPGHRQGNGCDRVYRRLVQKSALKMDLTEIPGLDSLKNPTGCLKESQELAARLFGAEKTFFLINGSTVGLHAALLAVNKPGGKIIVPGNSHVSVINGLVLSGGIPVPAPVEIDPEWGIPLGLRADKLMELLEEHKHCEAVILTHPSYQGIGGDIYKLSRVVRNRRLPLIVDEAHGAHLYFFKEAAFSAQKNKPDIVVHSTHKTLAALTQASMLHVNDKKWVDSVQGALDILQTTSPSYLLLASLDAVQGQMSASGEALIAKAVELTERMRHAVHGLQGYRVYEANREEGWFCDPMRLIVSAAELGLTGWELASLLRKKGIEVEQSSYYFVLFLINTGHSRHDIDRTVHVLDRLRRCRKRSPLRSIKSGAGFEGEKREIIMAPRQVFSRPKEEIGFREAEGRTAGKSLTISPPGIPVVWPGEIIRKRHLDYLEWAQGCRLLIQGLSPDKKLSVLLEE
ncbi:MAG: aminotransferase class I/II-fold pyridoxal phosphate-dependent enzyme [Peptococcaceae bacterium]|jgi:arginine/lysine/ornithine decarboxylase|nr:aminotransferase class I/II-fold pyridoxal phosphate-dependent enzyme [Peptococcaceae bacterium]MDH7525173.1 aminotransferase class I/II-fold pyridoxal phosphate-dependent enzyme [Peptococcaceae bacterium]